MIFFFCFLFVWAISLCYQWNFWCLSCYVNVWVTASIHKANFYPRIWMYGSLQIEYLIDHWAWEWTLVCFACLYASNILVILASMLWCLCSLAKLKGIGVQVILAHYALMLTPHSDKPRTDIIFIFSWLQCQWGLYDILEHPMINTQWW